MAFDIGRLRRGERIVGIGGILLFILLFLDWYTVEVKGTGLGALGAGLGASVGGSAWQVFGFLDLYLLLTVIVALTLVGLAATQRTPALPVTASVITTAMSGLAALLVLLRLVNPPGPGGSESIGGVTISVDVSPTVWAFLGFLAVLAILYGGYLSMREEGTSLTDARDQARAAGTQARAAFDSSASRSGEGGASAPPPSDPPVGDPPPSTP